MYFWTIQEKKVIENILKYGEYYPNIKLANKFYGDMIPVYPTIRDAYKERNKAVQKGLKNLSGILFGFGESKNLKISCVEDLYKFFIDRKDISQGFAFWNEDYCILKLNIPDEIDLIKIDFNDFIKLGIGKTNDVETAMNLEKNMRLRVSLQNYTFNGDIYNILTNFNNGIVNPILQSFTQVHYSHIDIKSIVGIYPMVNYKTGTIYDLNEKARELKSKINF